MRHSRLAALLFSLCVALGSCQGYSYRCDPGDDVVFSIREPLKLEDVTAVVSGPCALGSSRFSYRGDFALRPTGNGVCTATFTLTQTGEVLATRTVEYFRTDDCCSFAAACPAVDPAERETALESP